MGLGGGCQVLNFKLEAGSYFQEPDRGCGASARGGCSEFLACRKYMRS